MRYCKNCRILYSDQAAACPKCGLAAPPEGADAGEEPVPDKNAVRRDWLWIVIGVPALICAVYLIVYLIKTLG